MKTSFDLLIGKICVERGWLTQTQLMDCLRELGAGTEKLPDVIRRKGLVPAKRMEELRLEAEELLAPFRDTPQARDAENRFGQILLRRGDVTRAQLAEALQEQREAGRKGGGVPRLGEILMRRNAIGFATVEAVVKAQARFVTLICASCGARLALPDPESGKGRACKRCGGAMRARDEAGTVTLPAEVAAAQSNPKNRLGKYVVVRELGRGGMGVVYQAWDEALRRWVALKLLTGQGEGEDLARFQREAQTAAALRHPAIVGVYEVGNVGERHFIAMEFVQGRTAAGRRLPIKRAVEVMAEVAEAVDHAHRHGIIHRDIKPQNIMLDAAERPHVMDFGLAKRLRGDSSITLSGVIVGTPSYMPPEQAEGKIHQVDKRSDIYSLGAVLYELLTGRPPFRGTTPLATLKQVLEEEVTVPSRIVRSIPRDLETIVLRALEKEPDRRYPSAGGLAQDLRRWLKGEAIQARRASMVTRIRKRASRNRGPVIAGAAIVVAALVVLAVLLLDREGRQAERERVLEEARSAFDRGDWERAEILYEKAGDSRGAQVARRRREEAEAAVRERKTEEERKRTEAGKQARSRAQLFYDSGRNKLDKATKDLYRPRVDLARRATVVREAIADLTKAIQTFSDFPDAYFERGRAHASLQEYREADRDLSAAIRGQEGFSAAYFERGLLYLELSMTALGQSRRLPSKAKEAAKYRDLARLDILHFRKIGGKDPDLMDYAHALLLYSESRLEESLAICDRQARAGSGNERVHKLRGDVLWILAARDPAKLADAEAAYDRALDLRVNYFEVRLLRGNIRYLRGNMSGAFQDFDGAIKINGTFGDAYTNRGMCLYYMGKRAEGVNDLREAIRLNPGDSVAWSNLGVTLYHEGEFDAALEHLNKALLADPTNLDALRNRGAVKRRKGDPPGALRDYAEAIRLAPEYPDAYLNRSTLYADLKEWEKVVRDLTAFLRLWPRRDTYRERAHHNRAAACFSLKRYAEAIADWEACLRLNTPDPERVRAAIRAARERSRE